MSTPTPSPPSPIANIWRAPLVPVALAATAGIVLDRYLGVPLLFSLLAAVTFLAAWAIAGSRRPGLALVYLSLAVLALGAAYHRLQREVYRSDDLGAFATDQPQPVLLHGVIEAEPMILYHPPKSPLESMAHDNPTVAVLRATELRQDNGWLPVSGRAELVIAGNPEDLQVGDEIELVGRLVAPQPAANPGELDHAAQLRDRRIRARVLVQKTTDAVTRLDRGWPLSPGGWLAVIHGAGQRTIQQALPPDTAGVAGALLLGEGSTMTHADWEKYKRTGVIHALAISGLHLAVLGGCLWVVLRVLGVRRRVGAAFVALLLFGYALVTGFEAPIVRSVVTVAVVCGGLILRRPALLPNALALAWLTVAALNPTDVSGTGCQLTFLSVVVIYWGGARSWFQPPTDPLQQLLEEERPWWLRWLIARFRYIAGIYAFTAMIWLTITPLVAARYHLVAPIALLIGPPVTLLASIALVCGFLVLVASLVCWPLVPLFAYPTHWSLAACEWIVNTADGLPGTHFYVPDVPDWWLWIFYVGLLSVLLLEPLRRRWRWAALAGLGWVCVGLVSVCARLPSDELRCTFLAVGHGGCTVLETPDGRVLLYDAGAISGPDVTRRQIAPYLWSRGIRRIDEVFLSHADLDHFNGLPALLERFAVGQVTCTPTFADKQMEGVRFTLDALEEYGVPVRIVHAGDRLTAGAVEMEVLHPPEKGPEGNENARSMVLLIRHERHAILLTGDLEGPGLAQVLAMPSIPVEVLMAPHHGSKASNIPALAAWARPRMVVSCEGAPTAGVRGPEPYTAVGATFLGTWPHGAVTVRSHRTGLAVETYITRQRFAVRAEGKH
jgi:competence protein ComEC